MEDIKIAPRDATSGVDQLHLFEKVLDGTLDAITANPPGAQAAQLAGLQCLLRFGDIRPIPTCALLTTDVLLRENRDQVKRFTLGLIQSIDDFVRDRALGIELMKGLDLSDEVATATYEATRANLRPTGELTQDVQRLWTEWSKPLVGIEEDVPLDRAFDTTVLHEILNSED